MRSSARPFLFLIFFVLIVSLACSFLTGENTPVPQSPTEVPPIQLPTQPAVQIPTQPSIQLPPATSAPQQIDTPVPPLNSSDIFTFTDQNNFLAFDLPGDWTYEHVELGDQIYSDADAYSDTFVSPDESADMESLVIFSDVAMDNSLSAGVALDLLHRLYSYTGKVGDIRISSDQIMQDGSERFEWKSKGGEYSGRTYFEIRGKNKKTWLMLTARWSNDADESTIKVIDDAIGSYVIP